MKGTPIGKLISQISRQNQKYLTKELRPYQIGGGGQHSFLIEIIREPGINQDQLTAKLQFDKATTARAVKQLEEEGYIARKIDENDRRAYLLSPTKKGMEFYPTLQKIIETSNQKLTRNLSEPEITQLFTLLKKIEFTSKSK